MQIRTKFTLDETDLRTIRASIGRGGKASRKECVVFIDRAVRTAIEKAPAPKAKRARPDAETLRQQVENGHAALYPNGCPLLCEPCAKRLGITQETERERTRRVRDSIARKFGHKTSGSMRNASPECHGHSATITKAVARG